MESGNILQPRGNHKFLRENFRIFKMLSGGTKGKVAWALWQLVHHIEQVSTTLFPSYLLVGWEGNKQQKKGEGGGGVLSE